MPRDDSIFLSYARRDSDFVMRLSADLHSRDFPVWVDQFDIATGRPWDQAVEQALDLSSKVIVVLSAASVASDNVLDEISLALDEGKELLPLLLEPCRIPLRLRRRQHIDFTSDYGAALLKLCQILANPAGSDIAHGLPERAKPSQQVALATASIAVIPMRILSSDDQTRLIAGGLHDEVTTGLSRIPAFHVVSAATTRTLTADTTSLRQVSREFGVRYAIAGSLAIAADRLRVAVELSEIATAKALWNERFDVATMDLFSVIDRITEAIVSRLHPQVFNAEIRRLGRLSPDEMSAWELVHRARMVRWTQKGLSESISLLRRSLTLDSDSALAHAELARALSVQAQWDGRIDLFNEITEHTRIAMKIAPDDPAALVASCVAYNNFGRYEQAYAAGERAIEVNPNHADAWACAGFSLSGLQRPEEALAHIQRGIELSPRDPLLYVWHLFLAYAHLRSGDRERAVVENRESVRLFPGNFMGQMTLAVNLAAIAEYQEAGVHWAEAKRLFPDVSIDFYVALCTVQRHPEELIASDRAAMEAAGFALEDDGSIVK